MLMLFKLIIFKTRNLAAHWISYGMDDQGSITKRDERFFYELQRPDRLWDQLSLLSKWYRGLFPWEQSGHAWRKSYLCLVVTSRMSEASLPIRIHGLVIKNVANIFSCYNYNWPSNKTFILNVIKYNRRINKLFLLIKKCKLCALDFLVWVL